MKCASHKTEHGLFNVRRMSRDEASLAVSWAAAEGWNPGLYDADCFFRTDPDGFFVGELDGTPIGSISAVAYDRQFGFAGLYIIASEFRGHGLFAKYLAHAALEYMGDRNVGLDAVIERQHKYEAAGFRFAYRNFRFEGSGGGEMAEGVIDLRGLPFETIEVYDLPCFPAPRSGFLRAWINQPGSSALGVLKNGHLAGYGVIRPCVKGYKIGPLFADSPAEAEILFNALALHAEGSVVCLDTPETNPLAADLARRHNMSIVFETARMYTRGSPRLAIERIFGVTSFELG
ncbi:MAG: GNAT family N-acetyltransferase [bacterium]|nr:GNAT family N-acetyltransferase [Candidatus Sumerlaeota bacterium]